MELLRRKPVHMTIANLKNGDGIEAQFNPNELEEEVVPTWNKLKVLGMSHEQLQYAGTGNHSFSFDLPFSAFDDRGNYLQNIQQIKLFLLSVCYSPRGAQDIVGGSPPRLLFVWPKFCALTCVLTGPLKIKTTDWNFEGEPIRYVASLKLEEIRDVRLYMEDVRSQGTFW